MSSVRKQTFYASAIRHAQYQDIAQYCQTDANSSLLRGVRLKSAVRPAATLCHSPARQSQCTDHSAFRMPSTAERRSAHAGWAFPRSPTLHLAKFPLPRAERKPKADPNFAARRNADGTVRSGFSSWPVVWTTNVPVGSAHQCTASGYAPLV